MAYNNSTQTNGAPVLLRKLNYIFIVVQILIAFFLYLNCLLITTFFKKGAFRRSMRYILFAYTLTSDCLYLLVTNVLLIMSLFDIFMQIWICILLLIVVSVYTFVFPLALTMMTLERYVAICMPMQHGALCTPRNALHCILIINAISSIPISISLSIYWASVPLSIYMEGRICSMEMLIIHRWQSHYWSAITQLYFVIMFVIVVFCYVQIGKAARKASGETKKSSGKGLRTVLLHGFQLILCLTRLWCPLVEAAIMRYDIILYSNVRYANYIIFTLAPRCLSSLVYGLRDKAFFLMLKYYAVFGLCYKSHPVLAD
ncbi:odorant receptor 131-2-like [Gadus chalcogrammus]|uniref:odorant receptor 131-2-like n=1 Tax=Gadus chalcogrammus TaxID=1042646 RepID=UPI0024C48AFC|nr:odorant receptor 131-2-like [Gadus chalcogrammus]